MDFGQLTLIQNLALFAAAALVVTVGGIAITAIADKIADRTGLGEAVVGGALLGASTSLSGTVTSVSSAFAGHPSLAVSNAIGGIAAQTAYLALADLTYRRANLEHAAASATNLTQTGMLVILLSMPLVAAFMPPVTFAGIHVISPILLLTYGLGLRLAATTKREPMWRPARTAETRADVAEERSMGGPTSAGLLARFAAIAAAVGFAGWLIAETGITIAARTGLTETVVGALMTATATSLPELVTTMAAVRRGALQLAVGGIIGGNTFDVLFLVLSDAAYRPGSVYHAADRDYLFWVALSVLMTGILLVGLLKREKHGFANIGFESLCLIAVYGVGLAVSIAFL